MKVTSKNLAAALGRNENEITVIDMSIRSLERDRIEGKGNIFSLDTNTVYQGGEGAISIKTEINGTTVDVLGIPCQDEHGNVKVVSVGSVMKKIILPDDTMASVSGNLKPVDLINAKFKKTRSFLATVLVQGEQVSQTVHQFELV